MASQKDLHKLGLDVIEKREKILVDNNRNNLSYIKKLVEESTNQAYVYKPEGADEKAAEKYVCIMVKYHDRKAGIFQFEAMKEDESTGRLVPLKKTK